MFSIAFRYGLDYKKLAKSNNINAPYVIYPDQKIHLLVKNVSLSASKNNTTDKSRSLVKREAPKSIEKSKKSSKIDTKNNKPVGNWLWPVKGSVIRGFSSAGVSSKGIDIKAGQGALVKATADGTVVYAGNGLIGYGNLVIVKHNEVYLSAYAYNDRILVKEQQNVKAGDSLAVIGGKGNDRPLLHFEVRRDGQPIDPLKVLPRNK